MKFAGLCVEAWVHCSGLGGAPGPGAGRGRHGWFWGCFVSRRRCTPRTTKNHVQALSKQCPSTIQAVSKQGRFASKLCLGHMPELCVCSEIGVLQLRPSTPYIILKRESTKKRSFRALDTRHHLEFYRGPRAGVRNFLRSWVVPAVPPVTQE